jgi:hypothetical protein
LTFDGLRIGLIGLKLAHDFFLFRAELRQGIRLDQSCRQRLCRVLRDPSRRFDGSGHLKTFTRR